MRFRYTLRNVSPTRFNVVTLITVLTHLYVLQHISCGLLSHWQVLQLFYVLVLGSLDGRLHNDLPVTLDAPSLVHLFLKCSVHITIPPS